MWNGRIFVRWKHTLTEADLRINIKEQTKYLPTTLWCPGGAWAIFMAENCRKLFPSATRQRRSCLEAIKIATFVRNSHSLVLSQPVTTVAASVFVLRTPSAPSNAVYVPNDKIKMMFQNKEDILWKTYQIGYLLVAFARVFSKIYSSPVNIQVRTRKG